MLHKIAHLHDVGSGRYVRVPRIDVGDMGVEI